MMVKMQPLDQKMMGKTKKKKKREKQNYRN